MPERADEKVKTALMDEVKLLPCQCPFCKREGAWAEVEDDGYARVGCTCTALGPLRKGEQAAIEAWNAATRPPIGTDEVVEPQSEGVPASPSGYSAEPEPSFTVSAVPVSIPNAAQHIEDWARRRQAALVERSNEHIRLGRDLNDPDYRVLLGEHRAYMALRSFIHGSRLASVDTLPKGGDAKRAPCASKGSAVGSEASETPTPSPTIDQDGGDA